MKRIILADLVILAAVALPLPPLSGYKVVEPEGFNLLRQFGDSALYEVALPKAAEYMSGKVLVANLTGDREALGQAYATLLGNETIDTFNSFMAKMFDKSTANVMNSFCDWLWNKHYSKYVPSGYLRELEGMRKASPSGRVPSVDQVSYRMNVLGNMPADPQNIITALEFELEKGLAPWEASLINKVINHLTKCTWCVKTEHGLRLPSSPGCDAFGVWGSRTRDGKLFTSRNLDWNKDTGISKYKLVTITHAPDSYAYASFGFASGFGTFAGMNERGITTSEMNLDNAKTSFDGPPFTLRFRMLLEQTDDLASAKALWDETNNTDSMNYLIGSAKDNRAMAIEAMRGYSGYFHDNEPVEAAATCVVGSAAAGTCGNGFADKQPHQGRKSIGTPMPQAVWRTNHAVDPKHQSSQEPLFNDTTFRYELLHDLILEHEKQGLTIADEQAISIAAALGIKGPNFFSCDSEQFSEGSNVLSAVYKPVSGAGSAYVAWEDGAGKDWTPAACTTYVHIDLARWWRGSGIPGIVV